MQKGLVSILTPCYNTGSIVHRLLDSILAQDYPSIEMFAINDGSTDNTEEVIKSYIPRFEAKGYSLTYIYQTNQGQSAAINNGLKLVNGEFLCWPDSDDYYSCSSAIRILVDAIRSSKCHIVRCLPTLIEESNLETISTYKFNSYFSSSEQFDNCINNTHMIWPPINYMIDMCAFDTVNPKREIYTEKMAGQNWQMLLPLMFKYKCYTLDISLSNVLVRASSHSRGQFNTYEQLYAKINSYCNTIVATLDTINSMPEEEILSYKRQVQKKYKLQELNLAFEHKKSKEKKRIIDELDSMGVTVPLIYTFKLWLKHTKIGKCLSWLHIQLHKLNRNL